MRALSAYPGTRLRFTSAPAPPRPAAGAAVVHPLAVATCDLDVAVARGTTQFPLPLHLGHECVAEVIAVGAEVDTVRPGQRVVVPFQVNCGVCRACRLGRTANCLAVPPLAMYGFGVAGGHWGGAYSDELAVPFADAMLVPLPDGIDPVAAASVADNVCDAYRHVAPHLPALLEEDPDAEVVVVGAQTAHPLLSGSVPLYTGLIARALGAGRIVLADGREAVRAHAERLGLNAVAPRQLRSRPPAPLVVDISGSPSGLRRALSATAPDGVCSSAGGLHRNARIPALLMYGRNATLHIGRTHARAIIPRVLGLIVDGRLRPETVTTTVAPLDEAPSVLREHYLAGGVKTILTA
jgi:alcohol dehydrogenase